MNMHFLIKKDFILHVSMPAVMYIFYSYVCIDIDLNEVSSLNKRFHKETVQSKTHDVLTLNIHSMHASNISCSEALEQRQNMLLQVTAVKL